MVEYIISRIFGDGSRDFAIIDLSQEGQKYEWTKNLEEATGMSMEGKADEIALNLFPGEFVHVERVVTERVIRND